MGHRGLEISDFFCELRGLGGNPPGFPKRKGESSPRQCFVFFFQGAELLVIGSVQDVTSYKLTNGTMMPKWKVRIKPLKFSTVAKGPG